MGYDRGRENFLTSVSNSLFHSSMVHCGSAIFLWREILISVFFFFFFFFFNIIVAGASRMRKTLVSFWYWRVLLKEPNMFVHVIVVNRNEQQFIVL